MPQVVNTGKRENDYSAGMQMLSLAAERQSKKNQRQAILKNIMRSQGLNADVSEDGEIVFNDKKGENRISTQEAMDIGKVSTPESNLTRESEYNVESKINTDLTQDLVNMADQAMQNNQDTQAQAETKQAMRDRLGSIMTNQFSPLNRTTSDGGDNSNNASPNTSTNTPNTVPTADNQWNGLIAPRPAEQNPVPPMDYPKPVTPQPVIPPPPPPKFKSEKDVKSQKNTYQTGYSTDRSVDVEIDPVVTTEGYKVQGMRDEVQEDMRDLQRKATIFSALNGLDPNAHNPYAKMAEQRAIDLDFYNKNMVGVKQNMASATGGVKYKGANKEDLKVAEGATTMISTSNTTNFGGPGNRNAKDAIYSVQGADGYPYELNDLGNGRMGVRDVIDPNFFLNMNDFNSNFRNTLFKQPQKDEMKKVIESGGDGEWADGYGSVIKIERGMLVNGTVFTKSFTASMDRQSEKYNPTAGKSASDPNELGKERQFEALGIPRKK